MANFHYPTFKSNILNSGYKDLKDFVVVNSELYYRDSSGVLARALALTLEKEELPWIHYFSCGENDISCYRCLREGFGWHEMGRDAA